MNTKPANVKSEKFFTHPPSMVILGTGFLLTVLAYLQQEKSYVFLIVGFFSALFLAIYLFIFETQHADIDETTGVYREKAFLLLAGQHRKLAIRKKTGFYLMLAEVHPRNDRAIRLTADVLKDTFRAADIIANIGNGRFALIAVDASEDSRTVIEKRIFKKLAECNAARKLSYPLSVTLGSAFFNPIDTCLEMEELIAAADKKLHDENIKNQRSGS